jgi:hypothetical protein
MSLLREWCRVCRSSPGVVLGDSVDVAACGSKIVLCISEQIYTLIDRGRPNAAEFWSLYKLQQDLVYTSFWYAS